MKVSDNSSNWRKTNWRTRGDIGSITFAEGNQATKDPTGCPTRFLCGLGRIWVGSMSYIRKGWNLKPRKKR